MSSNVKKKVPCQKTGDVTALYCGYAVADAVCALARASEVQTRAVDDALDQIIRLQKIYIRARRSGYSLESFTELAEQQALPILRGRLGIVGTDHALEQMIACSVSLLRKALADMLSSGATKHNARVA